MQACHSVCFAVPTIIPSLNGANIVKIAAETHHTLALSASGQVFD